MQTSLNLCLAASRSGTLHLSEYGEFVDYRSTAPEVSAARTKRTQKRNHGEKRLPARVRLCLEQALSDPKSLENNAIMAQSRTLPPRCARHAEADSACRAFFHSWRGTPFLGLLCAVLALLLAATFSFAQSSVRHADMIFDQLDQKSGLPSPVVQAVAQDGHGFLWVGTGSGVSRWDGYHFRNYEFQVSVPGSLPDSNIYSMYTDPTGVLWIGTKSRGLARYDSAGDQFQTFAPASKEKTYATIYSMVTDGATGLWLATHKGIDHLDPLTGIFTPIALEGIKGRVAAVTLVRDREGRIWAGTTSGLFRSDRQGRHFTLQPVFGKANVGVWRLLFDREGRLWIGATQGAFVLEPSEEKARPIHESTSGPSLLDQESVDAICEGAPGVIWLGTVGQGIVVVDAKTLETHRVVHDPAYSTSLPSDTVVTLSTDAAGSVWVGTSKGLGRTDPSSGILTFFGAAGAAGEDGRIADPDATAVLPMSDGRLWLGLNEKGAEMVALDGARIEPIRHIAAGLKSPLPAGQVNALTAGPDGNVYLGTSSWVYRAHEGHDLVALPPPAGPADRVDALLYDSGTLWIGSHNGLWMEDVSGGSSQRNLPPPVALPLTHLEIPVLARGTGNDLWVATPVELFRYDTVTHASVRIPVDPDDPNALPAEVTSLLLDRQHRLWASTWGGGVCVLEGHDANGRPRIRRLSQGLPNSNTDDILEAPDGRIWVSTDEGFAVIDPHTFAITTLGQADGVAIPAYWVKSGGNTGDGHLIFGGNGGLTIVDPAQVNPLRYVAPVVVTDILLGSKPFPPDLFNEDAGSAVLKIRHDANSVAVEFASLDYTSPDRNLYAYKLDGFDKDWVATTATRRVASYTNLPPGDYTLELRGSNRAWIWGKVRNVRIRVVPAWYQTLWARIAAFLFFLLILTAAYRSSTAYLRARQRELERRVELRTVELKRTNEELHESRHQLEQMAHSDPLTGLPNRRMFNEYFRRLLATSRRHENRSFTLILFDLDKFKEINDSYGHDAGDAWLQLVAQGVSSIVRESDCFARLGGDEFAILLTDPIDESGLAKVCASLAASTADPLLLNGSVLKTTFSIGVSTYPQDGEDEATLLKAADIALYQVKHAGGNGWRRYTAAGDVAAVFPDTATR
jgi:diguanylate cyclase (GGDEF)-like protein